MGKSKLPAVGNSGQFTPVQIGIQAAAMASRGLMQTFLSYLELRQERLALEATLEAEIRKQELALVALQQQIDENIQFLRTQAKENEETRKSILRTIDFFGEQASRYVHLHTQLLQDGGRAPDDPSLERRLAEAGSKVADLFEKIADLAKRLGPHALASLR
ncbi:MAG: hypothetical protein FJ109_21560 [Deltaproteobacteria bacterium]|nr:hypothetical protein [Deltaproteobacteria bacterium]